MGLNSRIAVPLYQQKTFTYGVYSYSSTNEGAQGNFTVTLSYEKGYVPISWYSPDIASGSTKKPVVFGSNFSNQTGTNPTLIIRFKSPYAGTSSLPGLSGATFYVLYIKATL